MRDLSVFLTQGCQMLPNKKIQVSNRFTHEDGKEIYWEIRAVSEKENREVQAKGKHSEGGELYWGRLCVRSIVEPDLNDKALWKSYDAQNAEQALKKMLTIGEYMILLEQVRNMNGFAQRELDLKREAKN